MSCPKTPPTPDSVPPDMQANKLWRPPTSERRIVALVSGMLAGGPLPDSFFVLLSLT